MSSDSPKLLVVSDLDCSHELLKLLDRGGFDEPLVGNGGDETLEIFEKLEPDLVLLCSELDEGDASSLASAIQSGSYGRAAPILVVVKEGGHCPVELRQGKGRTVIHLPAGPRELARVVREAMESSTGLRIDAAMDMAIESFVSDAIVSLTHSGVSEAELDAPDEGVIDTQEDEPAPSKLWEESEPYGQPGALREPTFVLSDPAAPPEPPASDEASGPKDTPEEESLDSVLEDEPAEALAPEEELDAESRRLLDEVLPNETMDVDLDELDRIDGDETPSAELELPSGPSGSFGRALRKKMSAMAERLFPGQAEEQGGVDVRAPVNAHTEIDLATIGAASEEDTTGVEGATAAATFPYDEDSTTNSRAIIGGTSSTGVTGPALVGDIDGAMEDVAIVVARFWRHEFSGSVVFRSEAREERRVQFDKGRIVFCSSRNSDDRMGHLLLREGKINRAQLETVRRTVIESGRRMGEVLVDYGYLKPRELLPAVRQHLEDIFYTIMGITSGSYDAQPEHAISEKIRLSRHPAALIMEGIRRKYDLDRIESCLGGAGTVVHLGASEELNAVVASVDLSADEHKIFSLLDGEHTLDDIQRELGVEATLVAQMAYAVVCLGLADVVDRGSDESAERHAPKSQYVGESDLEIDRQRVMAKFSLVQDADYFQILGVRSSASTFEIRRAFEAAKRHFYAESFPLELQQELSEELQDIGDVIEEAYQVLKDESLRRNYLANLQPQD